MKKYVFLAFILIFGTSILSGTVTYNKTNKKEISIPKNIVENVDNTSQIIPSEEQMQLENKTADISGSELVI